MVKLKKTLIVLLCTGMAMGVNSEAMSSKTVYTKLCSLCHGAYAEGNPKVPEAPALNTLSQDEIAYKLSVVKGKGFDHAHERMEKNQKIMELRSMNYKSHEMAEYIYKNFHIEKKHPVT